MTKADLGREDSEISSAPRSQIIFGVVAETAGEGETKPMS